ncbi:hypothetical protein D9615_003103 [Tricholomella constricta]|uniref:Uncharacterized protein n=1 Tax=Tricholomella constricta TaxID=117010 RepID=A0A8H5HIY0_9AGAR|nr:hypothetical protein D9615_003103 [Tricholomella constricta]
MAMTYLPLIIGLKAAQNMTSVEQGSFVGGQGRNAPPRYSGIHSDNSRRVSVSEPPSYTETHDAQSDEQHLAGPSTSRQPYTTQPPFASSTATNDYATRQTSVGGSSTSSNSSYVTTRTRLTEPAHGHTAVSGNRDSHFSTTSDETESSSWSISPNANSSNYTVAEY